MAEAKVLPSVSLFKVFEARLNRGDLDLGGVLKVGAQYMLHCTVEHEVRQIQAK